MTDSHSDNLLSRLLISLLKGVLYRSESEPFWQSLLTLQARVRDHLTVLGLELVIDEAEGYAFLRSRPSAEQEEGLPRLFARRPLSYGVSLMLAVLRLKLVELDAGGGDTRLILHLDDVVELMRVYLPATTNEAKRRDKVQADLEKVVKLGFCRKLRGQDHRYEVGRVIKAFVDAQWLSELEQKLRTLNKERS